jgi:hypothetical protein
MGPDIPKAPSRWGGPHPTLEIRDRIGILVLRHQQQEGGDPVSHHHALPSTATAFGILSGIRVD